MAVLCSRSMAFSVGILGLTREVWRLSERLHRWQLAPAWADDTIPSIVEEFLWIDEFVALYSHERK